MGVDSDRRTGGTDLDGVSRLASDESMIESVSSELKR